ncbi:MAG TPA: 30S ribosomal protein S6 [Solirubrobacterales bacterium]|nr:30S ribosomal protein S6 [Solirubrobacterales bacterium]
MREYELVLMLDPGRDAPGRDAIAQEARKQIEDSGALKHENVWGLRKLAYEIDQRNEADYRWFRFEAPTELLEQLDHNLKIADGVLRFRIFKVGPETPVMAPPASAAAGPGASRERPPESAPQPAAETAVAAATETAAPAAAAAAEPVGAEASPEPPAEAAPAGEGEAAPEPISETEGEQPAESAE